MQRAKQRENEAEKQGRTAEIIAGGCADHVPPCSRAKNFTRTASRPLIQQAEVVQDYRDAAEVLGDLQHIIIEAARIRVAVSGQSALFHDFLNGGPVGGRYIIQFLVNRHFLFLLIVGIVVFPGVDQPVVFGLASEGADVAVYTGVLGTGRVIDPDLVILPPQDYEMAGAGPQALVHQCDGVVALLQLFHNLLVVGVVRPPVGVRPVEHLAVDAELGKLRGEVGVVGALIQRLIPMGHAPVASVLRGEGLAGDGLDEHGCCRGAASGAANGGVFPLHPVRLVLPPGIRLEIGNGSFVHAAPFRAAKGRPVVLDKAAWSDIIMTKGRLRQAVSPNAKL